MPCIRLLSDYKTKAHHIKIIFPFFPHSIALFRRKNMKSEIWERKNNKSFIGNFECLVYKHENRKFHGTTAANMQCVILFNSNWFFFFTNFHFLIRESFQLQACESILRRHKIYSNSKIENTKRQSILFIIYCLFAYIYHTLTSEWWKFIWIYACEEKYGGKFILLILK